METEINFTTFPDVVKSILKKLDKLDKLDNIEKILTENNPASSNAPSPDRYLSIKEASERLNLVVPTLYSKVSKGEIPGVCKRGKRLYFSEKSLIAYIEAGRKKSNSEVEAEAESYLNQARA